MANAPTAQARADMDPNYESRLRDYRDSAKQGGEVLTSGGGQHWFRPEGWNGVPTDLLGLGTPFSSDQATEFYLDAVKDQMKPGVSGDIIATTTMIDELATMERAFRARHTLRRPRATCHVAARLKAHGSNDGVFIASHVEVMRRILAESRVEQ